VLAQKAKDEGYEGVNFEKIALYNQKKGSLVQLEKEVNQLHSEIIKEERMRSEKK